MVALATCVLLAGLVWLKSAARRQPLAAPANLIDSASLDSIPLPLLGHLRRASESTHVVNIDSATALPTVTYCALESTTPALSDNSEPTLLPSDRQASARGSASANSPVEIVVKPLPPLTNLPPAVPALAPPAALPLAAPMAPRVPIRSEAMEMIARQADEQIRHGVELADRGALFAARADFIAALRLLAQGLDNDAATAWHSQSLSAALTAMKEAQDFLPAPGKLEGELDLPALIAGHRTPVLKNVPMDRLQAMRAMKQYFTFAQEQLRQAAGREFSGSMALSALGKLHAAVGDKANGGIALPEAKAITFFQAALLVCPRNYMAANDLGVLLAHQNEYVAARSALEHSVAVCRCGENLKNLSAVYRRLGQTRLADKAARDADAAKASELARQRGGSLLAGGAVRWVDPDAMPQPSTQWNDLPGRSAAPAAADGQGPATNGAAMGQVPAPFASSARR